MRLRRRSLDAAPVIVRAEVGRAEGVGNFQGYSSSWNRDAAMRVPTISRARDLIASLIASAEIEQYARQFDGEETSDILLAQETWMNRPDPATTRNFLLAWTFDDLYFHGRAFWGITARYSNGFPSAFTWLPASMVQTSDQAGPVWFGPSDAITFNGMALPTRDVVQFISPIQGVLSMGARAIAIAQRLDQAAERFARNEIPSGWLQAATNGEPMSAEELSDLAIAWSEARQANAVAALNGAVTWNESSMDPSRMQLVEGREYQAKELARIANVPPYLVGIAVGGMTYQNTESARRDLWSFGARPYIDCIEQTLSGDNVIPRGRWVRLNLERYLGRDPCADMNIPAAQEDTSAAL